MERYRYIFRIDDSCFEEMVEQCKNAGFTAREFAELVYLEGLLRDELAYVVFCLNEQQSDFLCDVFARSYELYGSVSPFRAEHFSVEAYRSDEGMLLFQVKLPEEGQPQDGLLRIFIVKSKWEAPTFSVVRREGEQLWVCTSDVENGAWHKEFRVSDSDEHLHKRVLLIGYDSDIVTVCSLCKKAYAVEMTPEQRERYCAGKEEGRDPQYILPEMGPYEWDLLRGGCCPNCTNRWSHGYDGEADQYVRELPTPQFVSMPPRARCTDHYLNYFDDTDAAQQAAQYRAEKRSALTLFTERYLPYLLGKQTDTFWACLEDQGEAFLCDLFSRCCALYGRKEQFSPEDFDVNSWKYGDDVYITVVRGPQKKGGRGPLFLMKNVVSQHIGVASVCNGKLAVFHPPKAAWIEVCDAPNEIEKQLLQTLNVLPYIESEPLYIYHTCRVCGKVIPLSVNDKQLETYYDYRSAQGQEKEQLRENPDFLAVDRMLSEQDVCEECAESLLVTKQVAPDTVIRVHRGVVRDEHFLTYYDDDRSVAKAAKAKAANFSVRVWTEQDYICDMLIWGNSVFEDCLWAQGTDFLRDLYQRAYELYGAVCPYTSADFRLEGWMLGTTKILIAFLPKAQTGEMECLFQVWSERGCYDYALRDGVLYRQARNTWIYDCEAPTERNELLKRIRETQEYVGFGDTWC